MTKAFPNINGIIDRLRLVRRLKRKLSAQIQQLESRLSLSETRISSLEAIIRSSGLQHIIGRMDVRLARLDVLMYYLHSNRLEAADGEVRAFMDDLLHEYNYEEHLGNPFPADPYYLNSDEKKGINIEGRLSSSPVNDKIFKDEEGDSFSYVGENRLFLPWDEENSAAYMRDGLQPLDRAGQPHAYLEPECDRVDIPEGAILADVGAAEGYFGLKHIARCKKIYLFECDLAWLPFLHKTFSPFREKVEIIHASVGDGPADIRLDDYFSDKQKPTVVKMDVEGAEGSVLRSMPGILGSTDPLLLLVCTYHRQEDWGHYHDLLKDRFSITHSSGYYWHISNMKPPFLRRGIMRAVKRHDLSTVGESSSGA